MPAPVSGRFFPTMTRKVIKNFTYVKQRFFNEILAAMKQSFQEELKWVNLVDVRLFQKLLR